MTKIGITGNPGVGKHTISKLLGKRMNLSILDINQIIISNNMYITKSGSRTTEVDLQKTRKHMRVELLKKKL